MLEVTLSGICAEVGRKVMPESFRGGKISLVPVPLLHLKLESGLRARMQSRSAVVKLGVHMSV